MNNPEIYWPRIDTEDPDNMLSVYALAQSELPGELVHDLDDSGTPWSVADEMFYKADEAYRAVFSGGLYVDPSYGVGLSDPDQLIPSAIGAEGESSFFGRYSGLGSCDFSAAAARSEFATYGGAEPQQPRPAIIFETIEFDNFPGNLGALSFFPYCAVDPSVFI